MANSTLLTLLVIPGIYALVKSWGLPRMAAAVSNSPQTTRAPGFVAPPLRKRHRPT
jgi:hypothetical protein